LSPKTATGNGPPYDIDGRDNPIDEAIYGDRGGVALVKATNNRLRRSNRRIEDYAVSGTPESFTLYFTANSPTIYRGGSQRTVDASGGPAQGSFGGWLPGAGSQFQQGFACPSSIEIAVVDSEPSRYEEALVSNPGYDTAYQDNVAFWPGAQAVLPAQGYDMYCGYSITVTPTGAFDWLDPVIWPATDPIQVLNGGPQDSRLKFNQGSEIPGFPSATSFNRSLTILDQDLEDIEIESSESITLFLPGQEIVVSTKKEIALTLSSLGS
jgi:hypothetical protein